MFLYVLLRYYLRDVQCIKLDIQKESNMMSMKKIVNDPSTMILFCAIVYSLNTYVVMPRNINKWNWKEWPRETGMVSFSPLIHSLFLFFSILFNFLFRILCKKKLDFFFFISTFQLQKMQENFPSQVKLTINSQ